MNSTTRGEEPYGGKRVEVTVSEPWEVVTSVGDRPIPAEIVVLSASEREASALIRLARPIRDEGVDWEYFVLATRYQGDRLSDIVQRPVVCNLTAIDAEKAVSANPLDLSAWRGGLGLIATVGPTK
jgi:hypothetical protein